MTGAAYLLALVPEWSLTLSLIFGGCCANAYYLEEATRQQPSCGTLLTFLHFACTTLQTLPGQLEWKDTTTFPRLRTPAVPVSRWAMQVLLYFASSLLNNSAFAFHVPVPVHIIFRSGGLVVNMALGWLIHRRRYSPLQIVSVVAVTGGVIAATLATTPSSEAASSSSSTTTVSSLTYFSGIGLLVLALVLSSLMGLYQEGTFAQYGSQHWREALFYNHFLSMPLFAIRRGTLAAEWAQAKAGPRIHLALPGSFVPSSSIGKAGKAQGGLLGLDVPALFPSLLLNILTQLLCINGVNRLTAQVSSLTVTLVLVVRKAVSLAISVLVLAPARGEAQQEGVVMLAAGAAAVCLGTVGYAVGAGQQQRRAAADKAWHEQTDSGSVQDEKLAHAGRASSIEQTAGTTALDSSSSQARLRARKQ